MKIRTSEEGQGYRSRTSAICCLCGDSEVVIVPRNKSSELVRGVCDGRRVTVGDLDNI